MRKIQRSPPPRKFSPPPPFPPPPPFDNINVQLLNALVVIGCIRQNELKKLIDFINGLSNQRIRVSYVNEYITNFPKINSEIENFYFCVNKSNTFNISTLQSTQITHREYNDLFFQRSLYSDERIFSFSMNYEHQIFNFTNKVSTLLVSGAALEVGIIFGLIFLYVCLSCITYSTCIRCKHNRVSSK